jgi:hypothetical protein
LDKEMDLETDTITQAAAEVINDGTQEDEQKEEVQGQEEVTQTMDDLKLGASESKSDVIVVSNNDHSIVRVFCSFSSVLFFLRPCCFSVTRWHTLTDYVKIIRLGWTNQTATVESEVRCRQIKISTI